MYLHLIKRVTKYDWTHFDRPRWRGKTRCWYSDNEIDQWFMCKTKCASRSNPKPKPQTQFLKWVMLVVPKSSRLLDVKRFDNDLYHMVSQPKKRKRDLGKILCTRWAVLVGFPFWKKIIKILDGVSVVHITPSHSRP